MEALLDGRDVLIVGLDGLRMAIETLERCGIDHRVISVLSEKKDLQLRHGYYIVLDAEHVRIGVPSPRIALSDHDTSLRGHVKFRAGKVLPRRRDDKQVGRHAMSRNVAMSLYLACKDFGEIERVASLMAAADVARHDCLLERAMPRANYLPRVPPFLTR